GAHTEHGAGGVHGHCIRRPLFNPGRQAASRPPPCRAGEGREGAVRSIQRIRAALARLARSGPAAPVKACPAVAVYRYSGWLQARLPSAAVTPSRKQEPANLERSSVALV